MGRQNSDRRPEPEPESKLEPEPQPQPGPGPEPEPEQESDTPRVASSTPGDGAQQAATPEEQPSLQTPKEKRADVKDRQMVHGRPLDLAAVKAWCEDQLEQMRIEHAKSMGQILERDKEQATLANRVAALEQ